MSFITKRERVFDDYERGDLPARNEGKLKTYTSCTDARAWSHFWSDKTEHLVDIIKRNNAKCLPKYIPIKVIVDTLMVAKNSEIARLKRKIAQFEQMLTAYENLDLDSIQKGEIAKAHDDIKAATRELDDMCLDLNLSEITEGIGSEAFETGKSRNESIMSRGDDGRSEDSEWHFSTEEILKDIKSIQIDLPPVPQQIDVCTLVQDPRIDEMQETIIIKDARLSAMQNTIAVMENDICEPYCIYAHIYTALEKIFGILCQNDRYKAYLDALVDVKDIRDLDITGKIMFKLKVFEKFCIALMSPCTEETTNLPGNNCTCYHAEVMTRIETTLALTTEPQQVNTCDEVRSQLVADIMDNTEMKDILSKLSKESKDTILSTKEHEEQTEVGICCNTCSIEFENLNRLKKLQINYEELVTCYENLKHERNCLQVRCNRFSEIELELEHLRMQLREYNLLWNEKEHFRKRSEDVDDLKERYLVLVDEATNLEAQLKAENEIMNIKSNTIEELRELNIDLERKLNVASMEFEKEKNAIQCKLKETECKLMCSEQQIRSLSGQVDSLLEQDQDKPTQDTKNSLILLNEIENLKEQTMNLKDALYCSEEEKKTLQGEHQEKLDFINALKSEIQEWKSTWEKTKGRNEHLEKYLDTIRAELGSYKEENKALMADNQEKHTALENFLNIINNKSQEINHLTDDIESKKSENSHLRQQLQDTLQKYSTSITALENENKEYSNSLELVKKESKELFEKIKDYNELVHTKENITKSLEAQIQENKDIKDLLFDAIEENKRLQKEIEQQHDNIAFLSQENHRLRDFNDYAVSNINQLQGEKSDYRKSLEIVKKDSEILEEKISQYAVLSHQLESLKESHDKVMQERKLLSEQLERKSADLENALFAMQLTKKESTELFHKAKKSETLEEELKNLSHSYQKLVTEKHVLQKELVDKNKDLEALLKSFETIEIENRNLASHSQKCTTLESELEKVKEAYAKIKQEQNILQNQFESKTEEINNLYLTLEKRIDENRALTDQIRSLQLHQKKAQSNIATLEAENLNTQLTLDAIKREGTELIDKLKQYEYLETEYDKVRKSRDEFQVEKEQLLLENEKLKDVYETKLADLQQAYDELEIKKEQLQDAYHAQSSDLQRTIEDNREISGQNKNIMNYTEELEKSLIQTRTELIDGNNTKVSYEDLKKEVENMKNEKLANQNKIRDLLDKLDESENSISSLNEDLLARDDKIAILENHINQLEEEVRQLHRSLDEVVDCTEDLRDSSHQSFQESFKQLEAHHSKATHNMKMEIAKLKNSQALLEDQLSATLLKAEESQHDQNKYLSQLVQLENEREAIVTELKQLEMQSCGNSNLPSINCSSDEILITIERIRKSLENTVLKVQTSSQLLRSKADEAMKIIEKEKQKIISEKEEAIQDRLVLEKQMKDLKENLGNQITHDKVIIKDLEGEIQNQKLIIDKINESTQNYITKLEEEMQSLKNLYKNSMDKISEQQNKLQSLSDEKSQQMDLIDKINASLTEKLNEVEQLQKELHHIKLKPQQNTGTQLDVRDLCEDRETQTILETKHLKDNAFNWMSSNFDDLIIKKDQDVYGDDKVMEKDQNVYGDEVIVTNVKIEPQPQFLINHKIDENPATSSKKESIDQGTLANKIENDSAHLSTNLIIQSDSKNKENILNNEEQTLGNIKVQTTDSIVKESFSLMKDSYINYKAKQLSPGPLEQHSISSDEESLDDLFENQTTSGQSSGKKKLNIITIPTTSSLGKEDGNELYIPKLLDSDSQVFENLKEPYHSTSTTDISKDKDNMFMIFKDSGSSTAKKSYVTVQDDENKKKPKLGPKEVIVEAVTIQDQMRRQKINDIFSNQNYKTRESYSLYEPRRTAEDIVQNIRTDPENKPVLEINMLRAEFYSRSGLTSDDDKMSTESYNLQAASNDTDLNQDSLQPSLTLTTKTYKISPDPETADAASDEETIGRIMKKKNRGYIHVPDTVKFNKNDSDDNEANNSAAVNIIMRAEPNSLREHYEHRSHHKLSRVDADVLIFKSDDSNNALVHDYESSAMNYSGEQTTSNIIPRIIVPLKSHPKEAKVNFEDKGVLVKLDTPEDYEKKITYLTKALEDIEKDSKKKIEAIKLQYDANIKSFINEHNQGVKNMQSLHEETLQDILKIHENEVDNLRSMSIEAMRKAEKIEKENLLLQNKFVELSNSSLDQEPVKMPSPKSLRTRRVKSGQETKKLTKTNVEAFDVRPKLRTHGPCTCSLDVNISDTVRNIFDQVDSDQRKLAEQTYLKYIVNKVTHTGVEDLDAQELSFLHFKVCRSWKTKISKEEALQKRIDTLEVEVMNKQRNAQQHMVELDRQVAEERRRLQEVREAVCREPIFARDVSPLSRIPPGSPATLADKDISCNCDGELSLLQERRSAGDLRVRPCCSARAGTRHKRHKVDSNKATLTKMDTEERRERRLQSDELPTRLRRPAPVDKPPSRRDRQK